MRFNPYSLRFKLLLASTLVEALMLSLLLANSMRLIDQAMLASTDAALKQTTPMLNVATAPYLVQGDYATLQDNLNEILGGTGHGVVYVVVRDRSGRVVARAGATDSEPPPASGRVEDALTAPVLHVERPLSLAGQTVGDLRFGLSTGIIAAAKASLFAQGSAIALAEIAATFILLSLLGYWLTRNLARFVDISRAIVDGRYDMRLPEKGRDEVARLARNFNRMGEAIERQVAELHASEHEFRALFEQAAVGMAHVGFAGEWLRVNDKLREILGYADGGNLDAARLPCALCHDDVTVDTTMRDEMIAGHRAACHCERRLPRHDGSALWVRLTVSPVRDEGGRPRYLFVVVQDVDAEKRASEELVTYRNRLEVLVGQRTTALVAANKELESFSYSVSHDLRAPLRAVDGYSQVLLEDYADKLDADGRHYLQRMRRAVGVMAQLIEGLLDLSRLTRAELRREPTDVSALALAVAADLGSAASGNGVDFVCAGGLTAVADPRLLRVALQNLLGNAWKFAAKTADPHVEFGADTRDGQTVFFVRDNGVGFDMAYADKLFGPFQRLHKAEEFEGSGIGLATVQRIVHRHGGKVWAEAAPGRGATFHFTLPCAS